MTALFATLASALAWFFSTGTHEISVLAWFAPAPVLAYAYGARARRAALAAFLAAMLCSLAFVQLYEGLLPPIAFVPAVLGPAAVFMVVVLGARFIWRRQPVHVGLFAFPLLAAGAEYLVSLVSRDGTFGSLAYTQVDVRPVLQIASVTGMWGITFLLALVASGVAAAWIARARPRDWLLALGVPLATVAIVLGFGWMRLSRATGPTGRVGLVAIDGETRFAGTENPAEAIDVARAYAAQIDALAAEGARVVLLPEKFVSVTPGDRDEVRGILADAARRNQVLLLAGIDEIGVTPKRNVAVVFTPAGTPAVTYLKQHLLASLERGYQRGRTTAVWTDGPWMYGVAIGKDLDFPALGRAYGSKTVGVLFVPAWDFTRDGRLHARIATMRAVENGFSLVRASQQGRLTVSDPFGRIVAERKTDEASATRLTADVPLRHVSTIYDRIGDWFAWACLIVAGGMFLGTRRASAARPL
jgi:apolipoprotein N-acyltransferase